MPLPSSDATFKEPSIWVHAKYITLMQTTCILAARFIVVDILTTELSQLRTAKCRKRFENGMSGTDPGMVM